jgi:hypothetical protein
MDRNYRIVGHPRYNFPQLLGGGMARNRKGRTEEPAEAREAAASVGKRIGFDLATWQSLDLLARERMMTFQELADEAFLDVLRKHGRPYDTRDALKRSARLAQANENKAEKNGRQAGRATPKSKRPAKRRARS